MDGELLTGKLLVATPQIEDGIFHRSVVLILDHTDDGAQGVVLNRPLEADVDSVLPGWQELATRPDTVFHGGPVQTDSALGLVSVPGEDDSPLGIRKLFGGLGVVNLDAPPPLIAPEVSGLRIFVATPDGLPDSSSERSAPAAGMSSMPRLATPSPTDRRSCGCGCCAASATSSPSSRPSPRILR